MAFLENFLILKHRSGFVLKISAAEALQGTKIPRKRERPTHRSHPPSISLSSRSHSHSHSLSQNEDSASRKRSLSAEANANQHQLHYQQSFPHHHHNSSSASGSGNFGNEERYRETSKNGPEKEKEKEKEKEREKDEDKEAKEQRKDEPSDMAAFHADISSFPVVLSLPRKVESVYAKVWKEKKIVQMAKEVLQGAASATGTVTTASNANLPAAAPTTVATTTTTTTATSHALSPGVSSPPPHPPPSVSHPIPTHSSSTSSPSPSPGSSSPSPPPSPPLTPSHSSAFSISELNTTTDWTFTSTYMGSLQVDSKNDVQVPSENQIKQWAKVMQKPFNAHTENNTALPVETVRPSNAAVSASTHELEEENQVRDAIRKSFAYASLPLGTFSNLTTGTVLSSSGTPVASAPVSAPAVTSAAAVSAAPPLALPPASSAASSPSVFQLRRGFTGSSLTVDHQLVFVELANEDQPHTPRTDDTANADKDKSPPPSASSSSSSVPSVSASVLALASASSAAASFLPQSLLRRRDPILFFTSFPLYEDELHDHGVSSFRVKMRVMPSCFLILLTFYLLVDGVCLRIYESRIFHLFGSNEIRREYSRKEMKLDEWKNYQMPNPVQRHFYQDVEVVNARLNAIKNNPTMKIHTQEIIRFGGK